MARNFRQWCGFCLVAAILLASLSGICIGQDHVSDAASLSRDYPTGTIQSDAAADEALGRAEKAREVAEQQFTVEERVCYSRFFVNACLSDAKEERHLALSQIKRVEIEANEFKRAFRVKEQDRKAAEKASEERSLQVSSDKKPETTDTRVAEHEAKLKEIEEKEAAEAPQRARNVEAYEEKAKEAEERKRKAAEQKTK